MTRNRLSQAEYTSDDLWTEAHTVPSQSLAEDWKETCERMFHRTIAGIQLQYHRDLQQLISERTLIEQEARRSHPHLSPALIQTITSNRLRDRMKKLWISYRAEVIDLQEALWEKIMLVSER